MAGTICYVIGGVVAANLVYYVLMGNVYRRILEKRLEKYGTLKKGKRQKLKI
jgi:hypothetical protein